MKKLLTTAAVLATLTTQAAATDWWQLDDGLGLFGLTPMSKVDCKREGSPAKAYEGFKLFSTDIRLAEHVRNPRILDKGDEVDVVTDGPMAYRFFRTEAGCRAAMKPLQEAIDKAKEKQRVEQQQLEKYR